MKNPVTTITGVIMILLAGLSLFGVIGPEDQQTLGGYATDIVAAIVGIIAIFRASDREPIKPGL